jgi:hypothetical protein
MTNVNSYIVQGRNERGQWAKPKTFCAIYRTEQEAADMARDLDEHGTSARVAGYDTRTGKVYPLR